MLISEVILENFMSYEYARVAFKPGVNLIVGPNGAGKSSLLLAISVALGQTYTERSKKLSNLIRWGKDEARVTVVLDNTRQGGKRPVPKYQKDQIFLTRTLRRDGQYGFEIENHAANKQDVQRLLSRLGVDPNNMLIIMQQNMVEQFSVLSNVEKLRMVEAAVGLEPFRENVGQAQQKLTCILSQSESVTKLLESAEQTLNYWREQYDKYQEKKQLQTKRRFLQRELSWADVERRETLVKELDADRKKMQETLAQIEQQATNKTHQTESETTQKQQLKDEDHVALLDRLGFEREIAKDEVTIAFVSDLLKEIRTFEQTIRRASGAVPPKLLLPENLEHLLQASDNDLAKARENAKVAQAKLSSLQEDLDKLTEKMVQSRIETALLQFKKETAAKDLQKTESALKTANASLEAAIEHASESGPRLAITKAASAIQDELQLTDGHLAALSGVSDDIVRQYESYSKLYLVLKEKAQLVAENRQKPSKK
jgi:chromosome segregation ATPase